MQKIDLKELYKNDEAFQKDLKRLPKLIKEYQKYQGKIFSSPEALYEFLEFDTKVSMLIEKMYLYAHINNDLDLDNTKYQEYHGMVVKLLGDLSETTSFVIPEILENDYQKFLDYAKKYPKLNEYKLNIKNVFRMKKLTKSKKE